MAADPLIAALPAADPLIAALPAADPLIAALPAAASPDRSCSPGATAGEDHSGAGVPSRAGFAAALRALTDPACRLSPGHGRLLAAIEVSTRPAMIPRRCR
ncbi:hypothetical protein [Actinoplanes sp. NPDC020271]|uniref:hypothetical protein n=1 Tax=Actinoplanes sp. NPDC020271 TaxID=3363896 RepID=UPI0037ABAA5C